MANWQLIEHASLTLKRLLEQHIAATLPTTNITVELATSQAFESLKAAEQPTITVFLYRCLENPELRNSPQRRLPNGTYQRQPLVLELCYLITPWGVRSGNLNALDPTATQEEHRLLGLILQCFYDHAEVSRAELFEDANKPVWQATDTMQIVMDTLSVEDQYRIWDSGELPYRLSVTYRARVLGLDSTLVHSSVPVVDARFALEKP
ncbi:MAG: DUF4255 domain-containing protein [Kofleriaceae bacterium]